MKQLILDVQARLLAQVPGLKYVDIDWGQLSFYNAHPPVKWPCALISFAGAQWSNVLKKGQLGLVQLNIVLADMRLLNSSGNAPAGQKDKAFGLFDLTSEVYQALMGWSGSRTYSPLCRVSNDLLYREDGIMTQTIGFTTELKDNSAIREPATHSGRLNPVVNLSH